MAAVGAMYALFDLVRINTTNSDVSYTLGNYASPDWQVPPAPSLRIPVVDETNTLTAEDKRLIGIAADNSISNISKGQIAVLMTDRVHRTLEDDALNVARTWNPGGAAQKNGVLLYIAKNDHKVRIEVADHLLNTLTTTKTKQIIENVIYPAFRNNDFSGGTISAVKYLRSTINGDEEYLPEAKDVVGQQQSFRKVFDQFLLIICVLVMISQVSGNSKRNNFTNNHKGGGWLDLLQVLTILGGRGGMGGYGRYDNPGDGYDSYGGGFGGGGGFSGGGASGRW